MTDFFGNVFKFATDVSITVETLPKYGQLFVAGSAAEAAEAAAATAGGTMDGTVASRLTPAEGFDRFVGACPVARDGARVEVGAPCGGAYGVGPSLSSRILGPVAARNRLPVSTGGEPTVWYYPEKGYLGPDDFSFSVTVEGVKSTEAWVAGVHTRR